MQGKGRFRELRKSEPRSHHRSRPPIRGRGRGLSPPGGAARCRAASFRAGRLVLRPRPLVAAVHSLVLLAMPPGGLPPLLLLLPAWVSGPGRGAGVRARGGRRAGPARLGSAGISGGRMRGEAGRARPAGDASPPGTAKGSGCEPRGCPGAPSPPPTRPCRAEGRPGSPGPARCAGGRRPGLGALPLPAGALAEDALARGRPEVAPSVFRGELETFPSRGRQPRQLKAWRVEAAGPAAPPGLC